MSVLRTDRRERRSAANVLLAGVLAGLLTLLMLPAAGAQTAPGESVPSVKLSRLSLAGVPQHNETLGSLRAPVRMLYFDDPQCPFCLKWQTRVLPALVRRYVKTGKLQIQWHGFAVIGPASVTGERFIAAAGLQNHLWEVLDDVLVNQGKENSGWLTSSLLERIGGEIPGFDVAAATAAAGSPMITHELAADLLQGERYGFGGVPSVWIGLRGRSLRYVKFTEYISADFEGPINRLLRDARRR